MPSLISSVARHHPDLGTVKTSLGVLSMLPIPVSGVQTALETAVQIIEYAEAAKQNKVDAREIASSTGEIVGMLANTFAKYPEEMDEDYKEALGRFHGELVRICKTMQSLAAKNKWHRLRKIEDHSKAIAEHKQALADARNLFQLEDSLLGRRLMVKQHQELKDSIVTLSNELASAAKPKASGFSCRCLSN
ncbi:hypothetical protein FKP32DRAFT_1159646 [Trametes sanguinea]|nr:hypothetical protein FKP32DRAFT_1159646 [Trametes sanguinea]